MSDKKLKRATIKEELVVLTGDCLKAVVLNQFIYWSERTRDFDAFIEEEKKRNPETVVNLTHGWIYKSAKELSDEVMIGSHDTVARKLAELVKEGWIKRRNNPKYTWDRTYQYRPAIREIQIALQELGYALEGYPLVINRECITQSAESMTQSAPAIPEITNKDYLETEESITNVIDPVSQAQPPMLTRKFVSAIDSQLHDEILVALNGYDPAYSSGTEKKKRKPRSKVTPVAPGVMSSDDVAPVPGSSHKEMFAALAALCVSDPKVKQVRGQLNNVAKQLLDAGYTPADLEKYKAWWKSQDWRGQRGDTPILGVIPKQILQAVQWVPWTPPAVPAKKNGPSLDALRSWHYQYCWEEWNDHIAADLGYANPNIPGVFKEWYDSEARIPDDQLTDWYDWYLNRNKEMNQW